MLQNSEKWPSHFPRLTYSDTLFCPTNTLKPKVIQYTVKNWNQWRYLNEYLIIKMVANYFPFNQLIASALTIWNYICHYRGFYPYRTALSWCSWSFSMENCLWIKLPDSNVLSWQIQDINLTSIITCMQDVFKKIILSFINPIHTFSLLPSVV